jgi:hypothetical protein
MFNHEVEYAALWENPVPPLADLFFVRVTTTENILITISWLEYPAASGLLDSGACAA